MIDFKGNRNEHLSLMDFADNNNYRSSKGLTMFDALNSSMCRSSIDWFGAEKFL